MMPSASDLQYFLEVSRTQNLSRAAERLGISQPTLSLAIQRLESSVGTVLLFRSQKGVLLTHAGKQLSLKARQLLQEWEAVKGSALASVTEVQGSYSLGCHPSVALSTLGKFVPDLINRYPRLELKLVHDLSRKITEQVIQMELDVGIVVNPVRHPDLVIQRLGDDEVTFWVGEGKRATQDFRGGDAVLICDPELLQAQELIGRMRKSGIKFSRVLPTSNLEVATELVAEGAGIGILPQRVVTQQGRGRLRRVPKAPVHRDEFAILYRIETKNVRAIQAIAGAALKSF